VVMGTRLTQVGVAGCTLWGGVPSGGPLARAEAPASASGSGTRGPEGTPARSTGTAPWGTAPHGEMFAPGLDRLAEIAACFAGGTAQHPLPERLP